MLFGRRDPPKWNERLRVWLWPRRNWGRSARYIAYRIRRVRASSHAIALGCASGVFASFTPFLGGHILLAGILAWVTRGSILASALGTFVGNPITYPFIWFATYQVGNWVLGQDAKVTDIDLSEGIMNKSMDQFWPILKPMLVGGLPLGIIAAALSYLIVKKASDSYRFKRLQRNMSRRQPVRA